ncbi:MAG: N-acetylmuramoyl-L-alanine amidase [bacterium]
MFKSPLFIALLLVLSFWVYGEQSTVPPVVDITQNITHVVVIDPAHGGNDLGVNSHGLLEKDINLKVAKILKDKLETQGSGITVFLTRENDSFSTPVDRAGFANNKKGQLYISIHSDYSANPNTEGYEVYYSVGTDVASNKDKTDIIDWTKVQLYHINESIRLATDIGQYMQAQLIQETGETGNTVRDSLVLSKYRKEKSAALISLEGVDMPAVVIELGNINNASDDSYLKDDKSINTMAYHIKEAVCYFLKDIK